jgi:4-hydroxy-tetrahydrodipicolinate synthase
VKQKIDGIIPVMLTPFDDQGAIDWGSLEALIEWYLEKGAEGLFAVCQSSEMQFLSLVERTELARFTVKAVSGRVPVIASGHIADDAADQAAELLAMAKTGIDGLVLVSNRLDRNNEGLDQFRTALAAATNSLPDDLPLGLYECPAPFRRLLTDDEIKFLADDHRFVMIKDVSCDLDIVTRRLGLAKGSGLAINNANAAIAHDAFKAGADGFCGVFNNFHPDLYRWLKDAGPSHPDLAAELAVFLALAASTEYMGYPKLAKLYHRRRGTFKSVYSRAVPDDIAKTFWALDAVLEKIEIGTAQYRSRIANLRNHP